MKRESTHILVGVGIVFMREKRPLALANSLAALANLFLMGFFF
jgi:hypothetical protein